MIVTVGHSNRDALSFTRLLRENGVGALVDVRSHPGSSHCPWFNRQAMKQWVPAAGVPYFWMPQLGGWSERFTYSPEEVKLFLALGLDVNIYLTGAFPKQRIAKVRGAADAERSGDPPPYWNNWGLFDYSLFMTTYVFLHAADRLAAMSSSPTRVGILCAEELWWRCHRSLIADYLAWRGVDVYHLQPRYTRHRDALSDRLQRYHPRVLQRWEAWNTPEKEISEAETGS